MVSGYRTWTVLPHDPVEKLSDQLWSVSGMMANGRTQRRMTLVKLKGRRLLIHNAIALSATEMAELEAWGEPSFLVVPNAYHRQDAAIWKQRYPNLRVLCPAGAARRVREAVNVDGTYDEELEDDDVQMFHWRGCREREGALVVKEGETATLIVNDVVLNLPPLTGIKSIILGPTGRASAPRFSRWMLIDDRRGFGEHLLEVSKTAGLCRVVVGHGDTISGNVARTLQDIAREVS